MENRFATTPPYPESVFDDVTRKLCYRLPIRFLGKVIIDSQDFRWKKRAWSTNPADDVTVPDGERARYTHGYFQVLGKQALLELILSERNNVYISENKISWYHYWNLVPMAVAPWLTPGVGTRSSYENWHEELHFNHVVHDWVLEGCSGPSFHIRSPHRENGDFQVVSGRIELGSSKEHETLFSIPDRIVDLVGSILLSSRLFVHACNGKFQSLQGLLPLGIATVYLECEQYFWQQFPIDKLLEYCSDPTTRRNEYEDFVRRMTKPL